MKTIDGNKLIAKFDGLTFKITKGFPEGVWIDEKNEDYILEDELGYDEDLNKLHRVFCKITKICQDQPKENWTKEEAIAKSLYTMHFNNTIESMWKSVVIFCKWYNNQQTNANTN